MNAALYRHAKAHALAIAALMKNEAYDWVIDYDVKVFAKDQSFVLRPDIAGLDPKTKEVLVALEVSDSTLGRDLEEKRVLYEALRLRYYIVLDVHGKKIHAWESNGVRLEPSKSSPFWGLDDIFEKIYPRA